jgi:hypothetical protein
MNLWEAGASEVPLLIRVWRDGEGFIAERVMACGFPHPRGLIFCDVGWPGATLNPFHLVEGEVDPDAGPPWTIGGSIIELIDHGGPGVVDWNRWMAFRRSPDGQTATPASARQLLTELGYLDAPGN